MLKIRNLRKAYGGYHALNLSLIHIFTLVVRREEDGIRRYVHLGTGNYNDSTAKLYTDLSLIHI